MTPRTTLQMFFGTGLACLLAVNVWASDVPPTTEAAPAQLTTLLTQGSTQYKLGDFVGAIDSFSAAVNLATEQYGETSARTVTPLFNLGMTFLAQQQPQQAMPLLARAIALSRRTQGLFNEEQLAMSVPLASTYRQLGMATDAEREEQYAYRTAEVRYGANNLRLVPALDRLARWYEESQRPGQARLLHRRAFTIASEPAHSQVSGAVRALIGIGRTYFIEYRDGPEAREPTEASGAGFHFDADPTTPTSMTTGYYLDPQAERPLQLAIDIATKAHQAALQFDALMAYGDYLQVAGNPPQAQRQFAAAAKVREARIAVGELSALDADPFAAPLLLLLRRPAFAKRYDDRPLEDTDIHQTMVEFTVNTQGVVTQAKIATSDLSDTHQRQMLNAVAHAIYRPRSVDGQAVATEGVQLTVVTRSLKPATKPAAPAAPPADAPAAPAAPPADAPAAPPADASASELTEEISLTKLHT
jgi:tetratricopeptide (TPR) repeat protein